MQRIIDSHCHIYPDKLAPRAVEGIDAFYNGLPSKPLDGTCETLIRTGNACGITHFVVHSVATTAHQVSSINRFIAKSMQQANGAFIGMGTMHLESDDLERDLEEIISLGLYGVKLHPDIQRFEADTPSAMRIYEMCEAKGIPICIHAGDYRYDYSNPPRIANILKAFPRLTLLAAHFGGWSVWDEAMRILPDYPNVIVDSSSSFHWLDKKQSREIIEAYGYDRVLFGTDYPMWQQQKDIDRLLSLDLPKEALEKIFWKNAANLFHLTFDEATSEMKGTD